MAYEYEKVIKEEMPFSGISQELHEVYRKAKAFDEIVNIEDNYNKEKGFSPCVEEYTEEVEDIISKYMEDE